MFHGKVAIFPTLYFLGRPVLKVAEVTDKKKILQYKRLTEALYGELRCTISINPVIITKI